MAETLWTALLAAQKDLPKLKANGVNKVAGGRIAKYVTLNDALPQIREKLNSRGLIVTQNPSSGGVLITRIIHAATGESLDATMDLTIERAGAHGYASAITYAKRYALLSMLGIPGEEDDDGSAANLQAGAEDRPTDPAKSAKSATPRPLPSGASPTPDRGAHASVEQERFITDLVAKIKKRDADHPLVTWFATQPPISEWAISRVETSLKRLKAAHAKLENTPELPPDNGDLMVEKVKADFDAEEIPF